VRGYGVPEDVSVIGVDDDQYACELQNPPLSSVRMASEQAGDEAAALLDRLMHGDERMSGQRIMTHATGVSARQSTNVRVVRHANVRKALRSIRENAGRPIGVAEIVQATDLSHRTLDAPFRSELGCSIIKQLTSARIGYVCRLLIETELRIHEIATVVGYEDVGSPPTSSNA
jgi:LacI family transcriptional regulator